MAHRRTSIMRPVRHGSRSSGGRAAMSVDTRWLATTGARSSNQNALMAVRIRPLSGMVSVITTSKAEMRSDATMSNWPPPASYRSRTFPWCTRGNAGAFTPSRLHGVEGLEGGPGVPYRPAQVEHVVELLVGERHAVVLLEQRAEAHAVVPGPPGQVLHDAVGVIARHAAGDEGQQGRLGEH